MKVHDLVFRCFVRCPGPNEAVVHLNGDPRDNYYKNLGVRKSEKGSSLRDLGLESAPRRSSTEYRRSPIKVLQFDLSGRFITEYPSVNAAAKAFGKNHTALSSCLKGKTRICYGFFWFKRDEPRFKDGIADLDPSFADKFRKKEEILQYNDEGKLLHRYSDIDVAAHAINVLSSTIRNCIRGNSMQTGGYRWRSSLDACFEKGIGDIAPLNLPVRVNCRAIVKFDRAGAKIAEYPSIKAAADAQGIQWGTMRMYIKGYVPPKSKFYWEFKENHPKHMVPPWIRPPQHLPRKVTKAEVAQFDVNGVYIQTFPTPAAAANAMGVKIHAITNCLKKRSILSSGYQWFFTGDPMFGEGIVNVPPAPLGRDNKKKKIYQFSRRGRYLRYFSSIAEAAKVTGISVNIVGTHLRGLQSLAGGFQFRYASDPLFENGIIDIPAVKPRKKKK